MTIRIHRIPEASRTASTAMTEHTIVNGADACPSDKYFVAEPERGNRTLGRGIVRMAGMQGSQQDITVN